MFTFDTHDRTGHTRYEGFRTWNLRDLPKAGCVAIVENQGTYEVWLMEQPEHVANLREYYETEEGDKPTINLFQQIQVRPSFLQKPLYRMFKIQREDTEERTAFDTGFALGSIITTAALALVACIMIALKN